MEETPKPKPVRRDHSAPIPLPVDDGESRPMRATASAPAVTHAEAGAASDSAVAPAPSAPAVANPADDPAGRSVDSDAVVASGTTAGAGAVEHVRVQRPRLDKRERRGAVTAGAISLPLVTLGLLVLAVPIGAWYVTSVFKSVIMAFASLFATEAQLRDLDASITAVDPATFGNVSFWLIVAGAVLLIAGLLVSWLVLRAHGVFRAALVTLTAVPMALGVSAVAQAGAGALAGLVFQFGNGGVSAVIANAVFGLLLFLVASVVIAIVTGILVWLWMSSVFRATVVTGGREPGELTK